MIAAFPQRRGKPGRFRIKETGSVQRRGVVRLHKSAAMAARCRCPPSKEVALMRLFDDADAASAL